MTLTANDNRNNVAVKGQLGNGTWNTPDWMIEPEANSKYVHWRNVDANNYLNVGSQAGNAVVETHEILDWDSPR